MDPFAPLPQELYRRPAEAVARDLVGRYLVRTLDGERLVLRLVEVEAYRGEGDLASHASGGPVTERSRKLYRAGGHAYVYLIYGMHYCLNAVAGTTDDGHAVLLRAGEPVESEARMRELRGFAPERKLRPGDLAGGPGKLCQAMGVGRGEDGLALWQGALRLTHGEPVPDSEVVVGPRIGVDYAGEAAAWPLRFAIAAHPHMSRPKIG